MRTVRTVVGRDVMLAGIGVLTLLGLMILASALVTSLSAQAPAPQTFDVASVKPNTSGDGRVMLGFQPGGRFTATNVPLRLLIRTAYGVQDFQIVNAPAWIATERFDIQAKASDATSSGPEQMRPRLRALLAERFGLAVRNEMREMPIYNLVVARSDGRLGPKLTPSTTPCAPSPGERGRGRGDADERITIPLGRGPAGEPPPQTGPVPCGMRIGPGQITGGGQISQLVTSLAPLVGRVVSDKTGLSGNYDFELSWTPETPGNPNGAPAGGDAGGVSIFTALQEQLGLKLDSERSSVDVLVIDNVSRPTPD